MKKLVLLLLLSICFQGLYAQVTFKLSSASGNKGDNIAIELRVDRFTKIQATQFAISYDTTMMDFISISDLAVGYQNISTLDPSNGGKKGLIRTSWNNADGENTTYPPNTQLMKINFKLSGDPCDSSLVRMVDATPSVKIEVVDENGNLANFTTQDGKAKINGPNCQGGGGGGGNDSIFTFVVGQIDVPRGLNGCVPITAKNFKLVTNFQGSVSWDKTIARFTGLGPNRITGISNGTTQITPDSSRLCFLWEDASGNGVTLADGTTLFELCFDAIGPLNSVSELNVVACNANNPIEVIAGGRNSKEVPFAIEKGSYKVVGAQNILNLYMRDTMGTIGTEMCVPIYVNNFTCIDAFQFGVKYDKTKLTFTRVTSGNPLIMVSPGNINVLNDSILIQWTDGAGMQRTLPNGSVLLNLCFTLTGPCDMNAALSFINLPSGPIEFAGCNDPVTVRTTNATVNIKCASAPLVCNTISVEPARCFGDCNGKITMSVTGGSGQYTYQWLSVPTLTPVVPAITTRDATTLCAGTYRLRVTDIGVTPNEVLTCLQSTITQPDPIVINGIVTNETAIKNDGKIEVTVTGGTPGYRYKWRRLPNTILTDTMSTLNNRGGGNYEVMVTDRNGCIAMDTFRIEVYTPDPVCSINLIDTLNCPGDCNATLRANISTGGTIPFKYKWSRGVNDTLLNLTNVCAGTYTLTVTDKINRTCSSTFTVTDPSPIRITPIDSTCTNGSDGTFNIAVSGGMPTYAFEWREGSLTGPIFATTQNITQRPAGMYFVKVTDSKGCVSTYKATIIACTVNPDPPRVVLTIDPKAGGFGTSCAGKCDGKITATASLGTPNYSYKWSHSASLTGNIADNLCAGNYTVTVTDAAGKTATATVRLTEAPAININPRKINCALNNIATDGRYQAVVSGGARPYTYLWCNNEITETASALAAGQCSLMVTDANGCTASEEFQVCIGDVAGPDCFKGSLAISPNGDGYNDNLIIECVEDYQNTLNIYNRWGQLVYSAVDYINQFVGIDSNGNILNEGTYMYVLIIKEPGASDSVHKGTVTIVRK